MNSPIWQKAAQYALVCAMVVFASSLVFYLTDFAFVFFGIVAKLCTGLIFFIMLVIVMMNWKKDQTEASYGQAFKFGLIVIGFYVVFMYVLDLIFMYLIAPNFNQELMIHTLESMYEMGVPKDQIDETRDGMEKGMATSPALGALWVLGFRAVIDVIALLIVAAFSRKEKELLSPPLN